MDAGRNGGIAKGPFHRLVSLPAFGVVASVFGCLSPASVAARATEMKIKVKMKKKKKRNDGKGTS